MARTDDDRVFGAFLSWWAVLGLLTAAGLASVEPRPLYEELPDAWVRIADVRPKAPIVRPSPAPIAKAAPAKVDRPAPRPAGAKRRGRTLAERLAGTTGDGRTDLVARLWEDDGVGEVDLSEVTAASPTADGLRDVGGVEGPTDIELGPIGGTPDGVDVRVDVQVRATVPGLVEPDPAQHGGRLPEAQIGSILYCYERRLMTNPALRGRIEIAFEARPVVVANSTGDPELETCIHRVARRWTLPEGFDTAAIYPVVLQPK